MSGIRAIYVRFVRAYEEFGSPGSLFSCDKSGLCYTWLPGVEYAASWHEDFAFSRAFFVSAVRRMVCGVAASN
jgi:hypothetical protein